MPTKPTGNDAGATVIAGQPIAIVNDPTPGQPFASVAVNVMFSLPTSVGVPLTTPLVAFNPSPTGSVPLLTLQV